MKNSFLISIMVGLIGCASGGPMVETLNDQGEQVDDQPYLVELSDQPCDQYGTYLIETQDADGVCNGDQADEIIWVGNNEACIVPIDRVPVCIWKPVNNGAGSALALIFATGF